MAKVDWSKVVDLKQAVNNIRIEIPGDWYQDPWGWPELGFLLQKEPNLLFQRCSSKGALQASLIDVPKENWATRPAVILDITDRVIYQALVDRLSVHLIGDLSANTFGWRLPAIDPSPGLYSHNNHQWDGYRGHLQLLSALYDVALRTDLVSCFASMPVELVQEAVEDKTPKGIISARVCDLIGAFDKIPGRSGLPQRSSASAVIANMYLRPLDDVLLDHAKSFTLPFATKVSYQSFARWMDDIWLFGSDPAVARRAQLDLQAEAQNLGLYLNSAKTTVLEGDAVVEQALEIEHSAVDDAIDNHKDFGPLESLVDKLLESPEQSGRTSIKFVAKRMRDENHQYRIQDLAVAARRMPHAADSLSRLFKEIFTNPSLQDWYLDYANSNWATHEWSIAQFGRMFPSSRKPRKALRELFNSSVRDANSSLTLLAVAAQRLCAWDKAEGRAACRDAYKRAGTPHARRVLALCALGAGETRSTVKRWLNVDEENLPTLRMLESFSYNAPKVQADFAD